jgi:hypothetical protein
MSKTFNPRDTPKIKEYEIYIPNGYSIEEMLDTDDKGYGFSCARYVEEVITLKYGKAGE